MLEINPFYKLGGVHTFFHSLTRASISVLVSFALGFQSRKSPISNLRSSLQYFRTS